MLDYEEVAARFWNLPQKGADRNDFLQFCHMHDSQPSVAGLGKDNLLAIGAKGRAAG